MLQAAGLLAHKARALAAAGHAPAWLLGHAAAYVGDADRENPGRRRRGVQELGPGVLYHRITHGDEPRELTQDERQTWSFWYEWGNALGVWDDADEDAAALAADEDPVADAGAADCGILAVETDHAGGTDRVPDDAGAAICGLSTDAPRDLPELAPTQNDQEDEPQDLTQTEPPPNVQGYRWAGPQTAAAESTYADHLAGPLNSAPMPDDEDQVNAHWQAVTKAFAELAPLHGHYFAGTTATNGRTDPDGRPIVTIHGVSPDVRNMAARYCRIRLPAQWATITGKRVHIELAA